MTDRILEVASIILLLITGFFLTLVGLVSRKARYDLEARIVAFDRAFLEGRYG